MRTVPIARAAIVLAVLALAINVIVLVLAATGSPEPQPAEGLLRWLQPFARPAADIAILLGFLSLLTERVGDAYPKHARTAVLIAIVAIVLLPLAHALLAA